MRISATVAVRMLENEKLWSCTPANSSTLPVGVRVWAACLDVDHKAIARFWSTLADQEKDRAGRFALERDRARFIVARGLLRTILAASLGTEPHRVEFAYSSKGKPCLGGNFALTGLQFNLAHSANLAIFAVAAQGRVGVDIEQIRPEPELFSLIEQFFTERECVRIRKLPLEEQLLTFFKIWTRKEAWLKATGEGITASLKSIDVLGEPREEDALHESSNPPGGAPFSLFDLIPEAGFVGALAIAPA